jgi:hypothetical protein
MFQKQTGLTPSQYKERFARSQKENSGSKQKNPDR